MVLLSSFVLLSSNGWSNPSKNWADCIHRKSLVVSFQHLPTIWWPVLTTAIVTIPSEDEHRSVERQHNSYQRLTNMNFSMETSDIRISSKFGCFNLNISTKFSFLVPPPVSKGRAMSPHKGLPWVRLQICASLADNWIYEYYLQLSLLWATPSPIWRWQTAAANRWFIQVLIVHLEVSW